MPKGYCRTAIPNRIAYWRERRGMTQAQLAARIYRQRGALAAWEAGRAQPPPEVCLMLARVLRVSLDELFAPW